MWFEVQMIGDSSFMSNHFRGMNGINRIGPPQTIWKLSDHVVKYFLTVKAIFSGGFLEYIHVLGFRMIFWKKSFQFWYVQSYLQIKSVEWKDQGFYSVAWIFSRHLREIWKSKLSLIELPKVPQITQNGGQPISSGIPSFHLNSTLNRLNLKCETLGGIPELVKWISLNSEWMNEWISYFLQLIDNVHIVLY